jgi:arginyl-tRNA--protein-N-Asp/Glu arginylyltransferase
LERGKDSHEVLGRALHLRGIRILVGAALMKYLHWDQKTTIDFSPAFISRMYEKGYVFTRLGKGVMQQTRSIRINLAKFTPSSENRRILKKVSSIAIQPAVLPLKSYDIRVTKYAKDFYETKFGPGVMSAQKVKEMLVMSDKSNFNLLLTYFDNKAPVGWTISYENEILLHYSYPFYDLKKSPKDMGLGMMIRAVQYAKDSGLKYIYLGSLQRPSDTYKLQFEGLEWFDGHIWLNDKAKVKEILGNPTTLPVDNLLDN